MQLDRIGIIELRPLNRDRLNPRFVERLQRVAQDFAQQHLVDQKLPASAREGYTLVLAMRSWELAAFTALRR